MNNAEHRVKVVVINANDTLRRPLGESVEAAGFETVTAHPDEAGRTPQAMQEFFRRHGARVVVYDIAPPYAENWALFNDVRYAEMISGSWRQFVPTTASKRALEEQVGPTGAIELAGSGFEREGIVQAVQRGVLV